MRIETLDYKEVEKKICESLAINDNDSQNSLLEKITAEFIRYVICTYADDGKPVHINKILVQTRNRLAPLSNRRLSHSQGTNGEIANDMASEILDRLVRIREVEHIGMGYYLPTATRFVILPKSEQHLIISGQPTAELRNNTSLPLHIHGLLRIARGETGGTSNSFTEVHENFYSWLGYPDGELSEWIIKIFTDADKRLKLTEIPAEKLEVYAPELVFSSLQFNRWVIPNNTNEAFTKGLWLIRTRSKPRRYLIGKMQYTSGQLSLIAEAEIPSGYIRRLQYGIDQIRSRPITVSLRKRLSSFEVLISSFLPPEEMRLFYGLGDILPNHQSRLPLCFKFEAKYYEDIKFFLDKLGLKIMEDK